MTRAEKRRLASRARSARSLYPDRIESDFEKRLVGLVDEVRALTLRTIRPAFDSYARALASFDDSVARRTDAAPFERGGDRDVAAAWNRLLASIASVRNLALHSKIVEAEAEKVFVERIGRAVFSFNRDRVREYVAAVPSEANRTRLLMIDALEAAPEEELRAFVAENVALIKSIPETAFDRMERVIRSSLSSGVDPKSLSKIVEESFDVSRSRARLIARDQVSKANGQIMRKTQQAAGVARYRWTTARDERVRGNPLGVNPKGSHFYLEGKVFAWTAPPIVDPTTGRREHPGGDYQCRCIAIPVFDEEEPEAETEKGEPAIEG